MRTGMGRSMATGRRTHARKSITVTRWLTAAALLVALTPMTSHAQLGRLKKLKQKFTAPDSAARAKDSLAQIAAGVLPESVKVGTSFLQKTGTVVRTANGALESATGISAKDAALAATGVGASNLVAKKLGLDPMSIGQQAIANAKMSSQQRAMQKVGMSGAPGMGGMDAAEMQTMQKAAAMANATAGARATPPTAGGAYGIPGYTQADVDAVVAFQQEMVQVSMAASAGDLTAKARLEAWETLALRRQQEMQTLSIAAGAGDVTAVQKLQQMQFQLMREWMSTGGVKATVKKTKKS